MTPRATGLRTKALVIAGALAFLAALPGRAADATREVHGSADAFAMPGLALAWVVVRAPKDDDASVVIRIEPDPATFGRIEIVGKDPFTQREERFQPATAVGGSFDLRVPRARFADFPRTEIRLWKSGPGSDGAEPALVVYYLGVPDTTPEVVRATDIDRSLAARIARARAQSTPRSP
jgi:hypothetical protein